MPRLAASVVLCFLIFVGAIAHPSMSREIETLFYGAETQDAQLRRDSSNSTSDSRVESSSNSSYKSAVYFADWDIYARDFQPQNLTANIHTHVMYSFADLSSDGTVTLGDSYADTQKHYPTDSWDDTGNNVYGCVKQLYLLKKQNRNLKTMFSIGGWTWSTNFGPVFASASGRSNFVNSSIGFLKDLGFDGIDIDWEYPSNSSDAQNFVLLLQELRSGLDEYASTLNNTPHFQISLASPAGPSHYEVLDLAGMDPYVDIWDLMAYDYAGSWSDVTGHLANVYASESDPASTPFNTDQAVTYYLQNGVTAQKMLLGLPIYGRSFNGTAGLGQSYSTVGPGEWGAGVWDYKMLPQSGATEYNDDTIIAAWSYDNATETLISYDNPRSISLKADYLKSKGLGGAMFWEASGDTVESSDRNLQTVIWDQLGGSDGSGMEYAENNLNYPDSQYDNLRMGMPDS